MTTYIWDASHFDGILTDADLRRAYAQGIRVFTHKLGEGVSVGDATAKTALLAAKHAGIPILGGYWFNHGEDDPVAEADRMIAKADADEPWWRDEPCWIWQPDCEPETGHTRPSPSWIQRNADRLHSKTGRPVVIYAPHWSYGSSLATVAKTYPLWNSDYGSNPAGAFDKVYPGDHSSRWAAHDGYPSPLFLQYGSRTTIAGKTTCDASAYRGTVAQLDAILGTPKPVPNPDNPPEDDMPTAQEIASAVWNVPEGRRDRTMMQDVAAIYGWTQALATQVAALPAAIVAALPADKDGSLTAAEVEAACAEAISKITVTVTAAVDDAAPAAS